MERKGGPARILLEGVGLLNYVQWPVANAMLPSRDDRGVAFKTALLLEPESGSPPPRVVSHTHTKTLAFCGRIPHLHVRRGRPFAALNTRPPFLSIDGISP